MPRVGRSEVRAFKQNAALGNAHARFGKKPQIESAVTLLPQPDSPTSPTISPGAMESDTPSVRRTAPAARATGPGSRAGGASTKPLFAARATRPGKRAWQEAVKRGRGSSAYQWAWQVGVVSGSSKRQARKSATGGAPFHSVQNCGAAIYGWASGLATGPITGFSCTEETASPVAGRGERQ